MDKLIPFNVPYVPEISKEYTLEVLASGHQQGDGPFTHKASKLVSELVGGGHVLLTPSCTHALEMASMLANIGPGDEVILPSYTFTSAATAVTKFGGVPVFVDIEAHTKGIDVNQVREAITPKTKAISWVNYAGVAPDIEGLQSIAKEFNLLLIEDNAHGLGGTYKGTPLGSFGDFATQSFHATKNIQCGEGGALIINNLDFKERAEIIREKGTDRSKLMRGEVQKYQWIDQGSSYLLAEVLCAILLGQLEFFSNTQSIRQNTWEAYLKFFTDDVCQRFELEPNSLPNFSTNASHMFYLTANSEKKRERLRVSLNNHGLQVVSHYVPLGNSKAGRILGRTLKMPIESQKLSNSILRFPLFVGLEIETVFTLIDRTFREM
jgi:dTDP-4-amino-4,6-dideoxygalactose transaminase